MKIILDTTEGKIAVSRCKDEKLSDTDLTSMYIGISRMIDTIIRETLPILPGRCIKEVIETRQGLAKLIGECAVDSLGRTDDELQDFYNPGGSVSGGNRP